MSRYIIERIFESDMTTGCGYHQQSDYCKPSIREKLYFISDEDGEFVKIGMACYPNYRIKEIQVGNPKKLILLAVFQTPYRNIERKLHLILAPHRVQGEWFLFSKVEGIIKDLFHTYYQGMQNELYTYLFETPDIDRGFRWGS